MKTKIEMAGDFIEAAAKYRFLYRQAQIEGPSAIPEVQRAVLDNIQKAHTMAQSMLRELETRGMPPEVGRVAWRLLSIGLDAGYDRCETKLDQWANGGDQIAISQPPKKRKGRLNRMESESKKYEMLSKCTTHPTLMNDLPALAEATGVSVATCRRWLAEAEEKHRCKAETIE